MIGVGIGAGYFSQFHYEAWSRISEVEMVAVCDQDESKAAKAAEMYNIPRFYTDPEEMLKNENPDFVDIITPPASHLELCELAASKGFHIICQKPLAPDFEEAKNLVQIVKNFPVRMMVHENYRFQPWHREIKKLLNEGVIGDLHSLNFHCRMGDGWGSRAYMDRQPYFRTMPRLFMHETGVHFIDTFRFLVGEIKRVNAYLRKINQEIAGEDAATVIFEFEKPVLGILNANRFNESKSKDPRYTFGTFLLEGSKGSIFLADTGEIRIKKLGEEEQVHVYYHQDRNFGGDCCYFTQRHFIDSLLSGKPFETNPDDYLRTLTVLEAVYNSEAKRCLMEIIY
ncbi:Gfo/Idh/MocA family oxidoreductase [soil metagenome]